ncbi:GNAT family N-acetyltransferase [Geothrix sp. 21YS21S-2]|uniref:GNAT family N-acetyltransferase n=1 Tax=Geothrix sp. 21YS21S-2 TaxID=3068893 RepID=UPI0027B9A008|nr:GNAT family N-acetyltransferase [Geothrix sp. 21YS21S-2]
MRQVGSGSRPVRIREVTTEPGFRAARELLQEYAAGLGIDLSFQGYQKELDLLPGAYAAPGGAIFLALSDDRAVGMVALRPLHPGTCELKRLFVRPAFRRSGTGTQLVEAALSGARVRGYAEVVLDTLPAMAGALALYRRLGFQDIPPYYATPIPGTLFLKKGLRDSAQG